VKVIKILKSFAFLFIVLCLFACSGSDVEVTAQFENTQDIKKGATVYYEGAEIGHVSGVSLKGDGSIISLDVKASAVKHLAEKSAIVVNRLKKGAPLELYSRVIVDGEKLQAGQEIEGLDSMFQLGAWMVGDVIQTGSDSLSKYVGSFQQYLNSQEFEQRKTQLQKEITDITESAAGAVKSVEQEMSAAIDEFSINEEQMAETIEQLGEELLPVVNDIARSSTELANQLEQFISNIENKANLDEQQSGEKLLKSLTDTFEKLNQSIEQGIEQVETEK